MSGVEIKDKRFMQLQLFLMMAYNNGLSQEIIICLNDILIRNCVQLKDTLKMDDKNGLCFEQFLNSQTQIQNYQTAWINIKIFGMIYIDILC
jgi:hypothetical protein